MEINLTKDAKKLIRVVYKSYLKKQKSGMTKTKAKKFGNSRLIHTQFFPKWAFEDVDNVCKELSRNGLFNCAFADDIAYRVEISDLGIAYSENRFKNGLKEVARFLIEILPSVIL